MKLLACLVCSILAAGPAAAESALSQLGAPAIQHAAADLKKSVETKELFPVKEVRGKKLMEIRGESFGKLFLLAATIDKGTGENGVFGATAAGTHVVYFKFVDGNRVQLMIKDTRKRAAPGSPEARAIAESYPDALLVTVPFVSSNTATGDVTIDAAALFAQDLLRMDKRLQAAYKKPMRFLDKDSYVEKLASFPKNLEVDAVLNFVGVDPPGITDGQVRPLTLHYSLTHLPSSEGFEPRKADPRVGYFVQSHQDLSNPALKDKDVPLVHYIQRWHLEKSDPSAPVSDVKKPIVYWLDVTIPHEYREYVRAGLLSWNAAFEAVGLRNAIVVKEVDKDMPEDERARFHPADVSYNVVRWFMGDRTSSATAPSRVNPYTGEVFGASIRIGDQVSRITEKLAAIAAPSAFHEHAPGCSHWESVQHAADALALAETAGPLSAEERRRFLGQLIAQLTAHEAGHNLGLRHNFEGGALNPLAQVGADGLVSSSFMHYVPPNLGPDGKPRGVYYQQKPGPYDHWAIEYGYKPLGPDREAELAAIAGRAASDPRLKYCTDEDAVGTGGDNPNCQRFVLGRDVVAFARQRAELAEAALRRLESAPAAGQGGYVRRREAVSTAVGIYLQSSQQVLPAIGGVRVNRVEPGMPGKPLEAVSADEQRAALAYLDEKLFAARTLRLSPELLQTMQTDRLAGGFAPNKPLPVAESVLKAQTAALKHILSNETLSRLADTSLAGPKAIVPAEVLQTVRRSIWREIEDGRGENVNPMRRSLQREHLRQTAELLVRGGVPGDASAQARRDLAAIQAQARRAAADASRDETTRAHLEDMARIAGEALTGRSFRLGPAMGPAAK